MLTAHREGKDEDRNPLSCTPWAGMESPMAEAITEK